MAVIINFFFFFAFFLLFDILRSFDWLYLLSGYLVPQLTVYCRLFLGRLHCRYTC